MENNNKYSGLHIALFCLGAVVFGITTYLFIHPETISELRFRFYKATRGGHHSGTFLVETGSHAAAEIAQTDSILSARIAMMEFDIDKKDIDKATGRITYKLSGINNDTSVLKILSAQGKLRFYHTYETSDVYTALTAIHELIGQKEKDAMKHTFTKSETDDLFGTIIVNDSSVDPLEHSSPPADSSVRGLFAILYPPETSNGRLIPGPVLGYALAKDTAEVMAYLNLPEHKRLLPLDLKPLWGDDAVGKNYFCLYAVQQRGIGPILTEGDIKGAVQTFNGNTGNPEISLELFTAVWGKWARATDEAANASSVKKSIAIVCDDAVISAPRVEGRIDGGFLTLSGLENLEQAKALAAILKNGALPLAVKVTKQ